MSKGIEDVDKEQDIKIIKRDIISSPENSEQTSKGWEPIFMVYPEAKVVIIGPAPGIKTQQAGIPFQDKSGDRLRGWMGISSEEFYESHKIAVLPLDFYFPGKAKSGDLPPRKGFAEKWHPRLIALMPNVELIVLMGVYAQKLYLKKAYKGTLTETVFAYEEYLPRYFPIVHSSPLNFRWLNKNPEFEKKLVPVLKRRVKFAII